jgi:hypothetical protein
MYQHSKREIEAWINKTQSFEELTGPIANAIFTSKLTEAETKSLLKKVSQKANVAMTDLRTDWLKTQQEVVDVDDHRSIALRVIQNIGHENIIGSPEGIWLWNGQGIWQIADDRIIKKKIHDAIGDQKITRFTVDSVLDLLKTEVYKSGHQFDVDTRAINCLNGELHYS